MIVGAEDMVRAASALSSRLPWPLGVLARLAYNYRWAWLPDGPDVFWSWGGVLLAGVASAAGARPNAMAANTSATAGGRW